MTDVQVIQTGAQATIILGGKLAAANVPTLKSELKRLIGAGVTSLLVDCAQLTLLDSTGIGCLVAAHNSLAKTNGTLALNQVPADIHELLCTLRLDRRMRISPLAEAQ